jgi:hypothetical protein
MGLQEPSGSSSLLGLASAWATHQDHRTAWENCGCVEEAINCMLFFFSVPMAAVAYGFCYGAGCEFHST